MYLQRARMAHKLHSLHTVWFLECKECASPQVQGISIGLAAESAFFAGEQPLTPTVGSHGNRDTIDMQVMV
jgi:hypothetical protein